VRVLLHVCCGPCACGALPVWQKRATEVVGLFFNPNIHPLLEYRRRLAGAGEAASHAGVSLVVDESYDPEAWFAAVSGREESRCERCIGLRLRRTAQEAVTLGYDSFSTTLSISPWQDHDTIRSQGERAAREEGVRFEYLDLRPRYEESRRRGRELGLYRQKYCGCVVSEWERYRDPR
jgi:predicted adenine nucleotide alpha hydrolase (AANH) superfamily ATPase